MITPCEDVGRKRLFSKRDDCISEVESSMKNLIVNFDSVFRSRKSQLRL